MYNTICCNNCTHKTLYKLISVNLNTIFFQQSHLLFNFVSFFRKKNNFQTSDRDLNISLTTTMDKNCTF